MILSLDHAIFGNGFGDRAPFWDQRYYWLVDTYQQERDGRNGQLYQWSGWFGAQLRSIQWTHPRPGERRRLAGHDFVPFNSTRRWFRVEVSWALADLPKDIGEANAILHRLQHDLGRG